MDAIQDVTIPEATYMVDQRKHVPVGQTMTDDEAANSSSSEEDTILELLDEVHEILDSLNGLVPNLQDPAPHDIYDRDVSPTKEKATRDVELAARMFPSAAPWLIYRLGNANSRRRRYLASLNAKDNQFLSRAHQRPGIDEVSRADTRSLYQRAASINQDEVSQNSRAGSLYSAPLPSAPSSATGKISTNQTIFSKPTSATGYTESSQSEAGFEEMADWTDTRFVIPPPPVSIQNKKHEESSFICSYCKLEVSFGGDIKTNEDWIRHVYADIEPYLCTFRDCVRANKTFGLKHDWIRHELDAHRIQKIWRCQVCHRDYKQKETFEKHLLDNHMSMFGDLQNEFEFMSTLSERSSESISKAEVCAFCRVEFDNRRDAEDHVAHHLEQFALTSIKDIDVANDLDADSTSDVFDDNASESRLRLETLHTFVEEQLEYLLPRLQSPPDAGMKSSDMDFVEDSDDDGKPRGKGHKPLDASAKDAWKLKVTDYLHKRPWIPDMEGNSKISPRSQAIDINISVPKTSTVDRTTRPHLRVNLPPRIDEFEGRTTVLERIRTGFITSGTICILGGAGGIGKTATAVEYAHRCDFQLVFWVQAETPFGCADAFCLIVSQLGLAKGETHDQDTQILIAREFLEKTQDRWLLVFDNVNEWNDIKSYIPVNFERTNGSILFTTRKMDLSRNIFTACLQIELGILTMEESKRLLLHSILPNQRNEDLTMHPEYELAGRVASLAERFPLAISHIAGYVRVSQCTLADFLELWQERRQSLKETPDETKSQTERTLDTIWNIGLRELTVDSLSLLYILAFLDSDSIQQDLIIGDHQLKSLEFLNSTESGR